MNRTWGSDLRSLREASGLTQAELAVRVNVTPSHLARIERGVRRPTPTFAEACDRELGTAGVLSRRLIRAEYKSMAKLDSAESLPDSPNASTVDISDLEGADSVDRRQFTQLLFAGVGVAALGAGEPLKVGADHIDQIQATTARLWAYDNARGSGGLLDGALKQLVAAQRMLDFGDYGDKTRAALTKATGDLSACTGWIALDSGEQTLARQLYLAGLMYAEQLGDAPLLADVLGGMYLQASWSGRRQEARQLAMRVANVHQRHPSARLQALIAAREAEASAAVGDAQAFERSLARAYREADSGLGGDDDALWLEFVTESELKSLEARGWRHLGKPRKAIEVLEAAVANSGVQPRDRASYHAYLADTHRETGEREGAIHHAGAAADLLESQVSSRRIAHVIAPLRRPNLA